MRRPYREGLTALLAGGVLVVAACGNGAAPPGGDQDAAAPTAGTVRAERRAYDGAPPTVPHPDPGAACGACHDADGQSIGDRFAPASPHAATRQAGGTVRCRQCHAFVTTDDEFVANRFVGLPQNLRPGTRATSGAPPVIPHRLLMRENCVACHAGPAGRPEIRTSHPERWRCRQCHVPRTTTDLFADPEMVEGGTP